MSAPGRPEPETFQCTITWSRVGKQYIPLLIATVLIGFLLFGMILNAVGLGGATVPVALVVAVGLGAGLWFGKKNQFDRLWPASTLIASAEGLEQREPYRVVRMRWSDMREIGAGGLGAGLQVLGKYGRAAGAIEGSNRAAVPAVLGPTAVDISPDAPALVRANLTQQERTTEPAITFGYYDDDFPAGRLAAWFRAYRPDLLDGRNAPAPY